MRLETRVSELERERHKQPRSPEIKVIEVWEVERKFREDGSEYCTEKLLEVLHLSGRGDPEETLERRTRDRSLLR